MPETTVSSRMALRKRWASFTLIELLVVMAIIAILASLVLFAGSGVMEKGRRSRASAEVQAMSTALESYKTDNGIYPADANLTTNIYLSSDPTSSGGYQSSSQTLYSSLSGQTAFNTAPTGANKTYMTFKANQVGSPSASTWVKDPWTYSYGYSTGTAAGSTTTNYPYNGTGFFDLWATGGQKANGNSSTWISNWQ